MHSGKRPHARGGACGPLIGRWHPAELRQLCAGAHSGRVYVVGAGIADWQGIDFDALAIDSRVAGGDPIQVFTGEYRRNPVDILVETVNGLSARSIGLAAGDLLSTGALTLPTPLHRGQMYVARFGDLMTVSVKFD